MSAAVLITTCLKYKKLWKPFFALFNKYWADCEYKVYLGTDCGRYDENTIEIGKDYNWATNCKKFLEKIPEDNVILLLEDNFFYKKIDNEKVKYYVSHLEENNIGFLRLYRYHTLGNLLPWPKCDGLRTIGDGGEYRITLQPAIWNKESLRRILTDGDDAWDVETKRNNVVFDKPFLTIPHEEESVIPYIQGVRRGIMPKKTVEFLKQEGVWHLYE